MFVSKDKFVLSHEIPHSKLNIDDIFFLSGTDNAVSKLKEFERGNILDIVKPALPEDAAMAIIKGGALRKREIYFPYFSAKAITVSRDLFPNLLEKFMKYIYH